MHKQLITAELTCGERTRIFRNIVKQTTDGNVYSNYIQLTLEQLQIQANVNITS